VREHYCERAQAGQKVRQSGTGRDVSIFHATHKGREEIVLSQPTPDGRQLVEVAVDPTGSAS